MAKQRYKTRFLNACRELIKLYQSESYTPEFKKGRICDIYLDKEGCEFCPLYYSYLDNNYNGGSVIWKIWCRNHHTYPKHKDSDKSLRVEFFEKLIVKAASSLRDYHFTASYLAKGGLTKLRKLILNIDDEVNNIHRKNKLD